MKRLTAWAAAAALLCALLCSCAGAKTDVPITVNATPIDGEIFSYYLNQAYGDPSAAADRSSRIDYATRECIRYLAVNTAFMRRGLRLTAGERARVSEETNALWRFFGARWEAAGVSKETVYKLRTSGAYSERLRSALFDTDGETPLEETAVRSYFTANYVAVRYLECVPADGAGQFYNDRLSAALSRLEAAAEDVNGGAQLSAVNGSLAGDPDVTVKYPPRMAVLRDGDPAFPQGFFAACAAIPEGRAAAFIAGDSVFLVRRETVSAEPAWYRVKRAECFRAVSEPYLQNEINTLCSLYTAVRHTAAVERCCAAVDAARGA